MRILTAAALSVVSCAFGATVVACFDLFHSTGDVLTSCEIDSSAAGCRPDSGIDLCAPTAVDARQRAEHSCAWLGACETPLGYNAFGSCMVEALMAFDCAANPTHRFKRKAAGLWACLSVATTCADVHACIFPQGKAVCEGPGDYTACGNATSPTTNDDVRIECVDGGVAHGENCALWGQTCAPLASGAFCSGFDAGGCASRGSGCYGATSIYCGPDAGDLGIDCTSFGSGRCSGFPTDDSHAQWIACVAEADVASPCVPDATATCVDGVAVSCPSGVLESLDCSALLGSPGACAAGRLVPPFDWTSACSLASPLCTSDSCDGGTLNGCERGAVFSIDCTKQGLGACAMLATDNGSRQRAACAAKD
jgi:hypothetical protein